MTTPDPLPRRTFPTPIIALDVPDTAQALALVDRLPAAGWVKVGLQLYTAAGPAVVHALRERGRRIFLDLKLHDIPNTVARAAEAAARLEVDLLTLHASGGRAMLSAARSALGDEHAGPRLLAVTLVTSLSAPEVAESWGRESVSAEDEVVRLARLAAESGMDGVVASVHEVPAIRAGASEDLVLLTPGIRLPGDSPGDQARIATPATAARLGVDFMVVGRSVTAAPDPAAAFEQVLAGISEALGE